ncbi:MAG: 16S rRNA (uracil(1498)-N(3))-methyltransferase [Clostridia bacterium]|nr:16S rRNA (uracil(1498)-N(3))-methyltransferase [Clostridia bacterium]
MPRFFVNKEDIITDCEGTKITIRGEDAHHISRSLRMAVGEKIEICDKCGTVYSCVLSAFTDKEVVALAESSYLVDTEPRVKITLYQALPKSDKMETIIQKSIECGAYKIVPFRSEFCVVKLDSRDAEKKRERWQKIAEGAAKQSGRGIIPEVSAPLDFKIAIEDAIKNDLVIFCNEREKEATLKNVLDNIEAKSIAVIIGAEGGFSEREAEYISGKGAKSITLGKRILRCETAPTFVLGIISYKYEM